MLLICMMYHVYIIYINMNGNIYIYVHYICVSYMIYVYVIVIHDTRICYSNT